MHRKTRVGDGKADKDRVESSLQVSHTYEGFMDISLSIGKQQPKVRKVSWLGRLDMWSVCIAAFWETDTDVDDM